MDWTAVFGGMIGGIIGSCIMLYFQFRTRKIKAEDEIRYKKEEVFLDIHRCKNSPSFPPFPLGLPTWEELVKMKQEAKNKSKEIEK